MADVSAATWHESDSANTDAPPDGWPEGQPANSVNNCARSMMGGIKRWYDRINATQTSGGSANAQTLTFTVPPTALVKGDRYAFIAGFTNTSATTLNVGVGGALAVKVGATDLVAGSITAGDVVEVAYDGTLFQFLGWDPARIIPQNLTVNTLTATANGDAIYANAGNVRAAGDVRAGGNVIGGNNITIAGNYFYLNGSTGTVNSTGGNFIYADSLNAVWHLPNSSGSFIIQNQAGTNVHTFVGNGNAFHAGTLGVTGAVAFSTTLNVSGTTTLNALSVGNIASIGTLSVPGAVAFSTTLNVSGLTTLNALSVGNIASIGTLSASGAVAFSSTLNVSGLTTLNALSVGNIASIGTLTVGGGASVSNGFTVVDGGFAVSSGNSSLSGGLFVSGDLGGNVGIEANNAIQSNYVGTALYAPNGAVVSVDITISGTALKPGGGAWGATSDSRVKKSVTPYAASLDKVLQLTPVSYQYNGLGGTLDNGKTYVGLIADDVQKIMPEMVDSQSVKLNPGDTEDTSILTLDSTALIFALVNTVKDLNARIAALEAKDGTPPT